MVLEDVHTIQRHRRRRIDVDLAVRTLKTELAESCAAYIYNANASVDLLCGALDCARRCVYASTRRCLLP